jgi:hypothetical protein
MSEIVFNIIIVIALLLFAASLNTCNNEHFKTKCESAGGTYYKSINSNNSLCKQP